MPTELIVACVTALLSVLTGIMLVSYQRNLSSRDAAAKEAKDKEDTAWTKWRNDMEVRMSRSEGEVQRIEVDMQNKVGREDQERSLKAVFEEIKGIRASIDTKFDNLPATLLQIMQLNQHKP
jgi:capsid protein